MQVADDSVAYCCYLAISIPEFFPKTSADPVQAPYVENDKMNNAERGRASASAPAGAGAGASAANRPPRQRQNIRVFGPISAIIWLVRRLSDRDRN